MLNSEHHQQQEQEDVEHRIRRQGIQRITAEASRDEQSQCQIDHDDRQAICNGILDAFLLIRLRTLQEEAHRHRDDRPDARHRHSEQTTDEAHQQDVPQRTVGNAVAAAHRAQLLNDRSPETFGVELRGLSVERCIHRSRVGLNSGSSIGIGLLLFLCRSFSWNVLPSFGGVGGGFHRRALAALLQHNLARRHAHLVIARTPLQVGVDVVLRLRELHLLHKLHGILEVAQFHAEHLVVLRDFLTLRSELSHQLHTILLVDMQRSLDGTILTEVCRVDVPAGIDGGAEDHLRLRTGARLQFRLEFHGVLHLCLYGKEDHQKKTNCS